VLIVGQAERMRMPVIYASREFVDVGGLMTYSVNYPDLYRRAAGLVDKIFKGVRPGDLPVEQADQARASGQPQDGAGDRSRTAAMLLARAKR